MTWARGPWASGPWGAQEAPAVASRTGTLSSTLGALTSTATGTVALKGTTTATLGALTSSATGTVALAGTLSQTLGALTLTSTGELTSPGTGTLSQTLGALQLSATATNDSPISPADSSGGWEDSRRRLRIPDPPSAEEVQARREAMGIVPKRPKLKARSADQAEPTPAEPTPIEVPQLQGIDLAIWLELLRDDIDRGVEKLPLQQIDFMRQAERQAAQRLEEQDVAFVVGATLAMLD